MAPELKAAELAKKLSFYLKFKPKVTYICHL